MIPHDGEDVKNPLRVVMGNRDITAGSSVLDDQAELLHVRGHDFSALISALLEKGVKQVFVESGSELGTAMVEAGLIDEIMLFQAPTLLGGGRSFIGDLGITTLDQRFDLTVLATRQIGPDIFTHLKVGA